jgi:hypothetical protein
MSNLEEFSFVKNEEWLKPFLTKLKEHNMDNLQPLTFQDAIDFAIYNVDTVFRSCSCLLPSTSNTMWKACVAKEYQNENIDINCRISKGFGNRYVPYMKKFNPKFRQEKYKDVLLIAEQSYKYLYYRNEIETILTTPMSDYTRFCTHTETNMLDGIFILNFRFIQSQYGHNSVEAILFTYNLNNSYLQYRT